MDFQSRRDSHRLHSGRLRWSGSPCVTCSLRLGLKGKGQNLDCDTLKRIRIEIKVKCFLCSKYVQGLKFTAETLEIVRNTLIIGNRNTTRSNTYLVYTRHRRFLHILGHIGKPWFAVAVCQQPCRRHGFHKASSPYKGSCSDH